MVDSEVAWVQEDRIEIPLKFLNPTPIFMIRLLTFVLLYSFPFFWLSFSFAQKSFEGKVSYTITYNNLPAEMEQMKAMLPSQSVLFLKGNMSRTEQNMGIGGSQVVISDSRNKTGTVLIDGLGGKYFIKVSKADIEKSEKENPEPSFSYVSGTKTIAGFSCKRAEAKFDGMDEVLAIYYTEEIPADKSTQFKGLKGFPLEYETASEGFKMTISAKSISREALSDALFKVPEGYKETTMEELSRMMGGY